MAAQGDLAERLQLVHYALEKIDRGKGVSGAAYGLCEECHKNIPSDRLYSLPDALYSVDCQREIEAQEPLESHDNISALVTAFLDNEEDSYGGGIALARGEKVA